MAKKKGLPPSGSTSGKSALTIRNRFFAASSIVEGSLYGPIRGELAIALRERPSALIPCFPKNRPRVESLVRKAPTIRKVSPSVSFRMADYPPSGVPKTCLKALPSRRDTCIALPERNIKSDDFEQRLA